MRINEDKRHIYETVVITKIKCGFHLVSRLTIQQQSVFSTTYLLLLLARVLL